MLADSIFWFLFTQSFFLLISGGLLFSAGLLVGIAFAMRRGRQERNEIEQAFLCDNQRLQSERDEARQEARALRDSLDAQTTKTVIARELCADLAASRDRMEQERIEVEDALTESRRLVDQIDQQLAEQRQCSVRAQDELHQARQRHLEMLRTLQSEWQTVQTELERHAVQRQREIDELRDALTTANDQVVQLTADNERLQKSAQRLSTDLTNQDSPTESGDQARRLASLEAAFQDQARRLDEARTQVEELRGQKRAAERRLSTLQSDMRNLRAEADNLRLVEIKLAAEQQQVVTLRESLANEQARVDVAIRQRDEALRSRQEQLAESAGLRVQVDNQAATLRYLRHQLDTAQMQLSEARSEKDQLQNELQTLQTVRKEQDELLEERQAMLDRIRNQIGGRIHQLVAQRDHAMAEVKQLRSQVQHWKRVHDANRKALSDLNRKQTELKSQLESGSFPRVVGGGTGEGAPASRGVQIDPLLGMLYDDPPAHRDDLKQINGIADKLEARLNELGVYTFEQIANWDDAAMGEVTRRLKLYSGRIQRDQWQVQARRKLGTQPPRRAA